MSSTRLRVIDLTDELSFQAARLFVGLGAGRDPPRAAGRTGADPVGAAALALRQASGPPRRPGDADALVSRGCPRGGCRPGVRRRTGLRTPALRDAEPEVWRHVVHVLVTPFGRTGAGRDWLADDTVSPRPAAWPVARRHPREAPEPPPREQGLQLAGARPAIGAATSRSSPATGPGRVSWWRSPPRRASPRPLRPARSRGSTEAPSRAARPASTVTSRTASSPRPTDTSAAATPAAPACGTTCSPGWPRRARPRTSPTRSRADVEYRWRGQPRR